MNYLLPMAGAGERFKQAGYKLPKPLLPVVDHQSGREIPMSIAATKDFPHLSVDSKMIIIDRTDYAQLSEYHLLKKEYPEAEFVSLDKLASGTVASCLMAESSINRDEELFIGSCDNGMIYDLSKFDQAKNQADVLIFTYRHQEAVELNPESFGWVKTDENQNALLISVKKPISQNPKNDHAIVASFWYRKGGFFLDSAKEMVAALDKVKDEFYIDQSLNYCLKRGLKVKVFEVDRYLNWGTPADYENYQKTIKYWMSFYDQL